MVRFYVNIVNMNENKNELSARHKEILSYIVEKIKESGYPPTVRE
ncbi:MAG: repressor LexA, partial [Actinobacteria bacterium]|nr:repressor LexA [Actinomycetota bacterium]